MSKKQKPKEVPMWAKLGHGKPVSRRDLLATGVIPFAAWAVGPALSSLLYPLEAIGQEVNCASTGMRSYIPLITLNLSGGPSLASQVVVKDLNGANLPTYTKLGQGLGPGIAYNVVREFGNVEFAGTAIGGNGANTMVSNFLVGVRAPRGGNARIAALDKTAFVWAAATSNDDSSANPLDITGMAIKMGLQGSKLPNLGRNDTATGIGQKAAMIPPPSPFVVGNVNDLANALAYSAALRNMNTAQKSKLAGLISRLSGSQVRRIASTSGNVAVAQMIECAGIKNVEMVSTGGGDVNPFSTSIATQLRTIWGINNVNDMNSQNAVFSAMVYNALVGNSSTVNLNMGGYDYHDNTRTTGNARDLEAGQVIGKILETADALQKPVFIYVCADGATVSTENSTADGAWTSDRGIAGMQYILAYHPAGRPATSGFQIGGFNSGQGVDGKFPTGANTELAAQAVFANYAAWNKRIDFLEANRIASDSALRNQVIKLQAG
jgi:hypothetical protein